MKPICQGRIVWAEFADKNGHRKHRPAIILNSNDDIHAGNPLTVVVASHSSAKVTPRPDTWIEIPYNPSGPCRTGLSKITVAICEWIAPFESAGLTDDDLAGVVPPSIMLKIIQKVTRIQLASGVAPEALPPM